MNSIDRAVSGAAGAPLSARQKRDVVLAAAQAWRKAGRPYFDAAADAAGDPLALSEAQAFELWRHESQAAACGRKHLTACTQREYPGLVAHFLRTAGKEAAADYWAERAAFDPARQARAKLDATLREVAGTIERPADYAAAIARSKFKTADLAALSARQAWVLVFDLRRAAQKRRLRGRTGLVAPRSPAGSGVGPDPQPAPYNGRTAGAGG